MSYLNITETYPESFNSLIHAVQYFHCEEKAIRYLQHRRWNGKPICPHCGHAKVYCFRDKKRFKCSACLKQFTATIGTVFENSKIPLTKWFIAIYLVSSHKKGISSHQVAKHLQVTQKTAWFLLHRVRYLLGIENDPNEQLDDIVEADETFVGGKNKNRHKDKKVENSQGRSFKDKTPILGLMQRGGKVKTIVIPSTKGEYIQPLVRQIVKDGSMLMTDEWSAYHGLNEHYAHGVIDHGRGQYVNGHIHTNTIEGFWTWIKRMIIGIYHSVKRKYLQYYANEATFRYNTRSLSDGERFAYLLASSNGRLLYKKLTND